MYNKLDQETPLSILQISSSDGGGGGGQIPYTLHNEFLERGNNSKLLVKTKRSFNPNIYYITKDEKIITNVLACLRISGIKKTYISYLLKIILNPSLLLRVLNGCDDVSPTRVRKTMKHVLSDYHPDIVQCHNLHMWYFGLENLPWLSHTVPTILTLHDAWPLAGHCAHSLDCDLWKTGCGNCPQLNLYIPILKDATHRNWENKRHIYQKSQLHIVTPSKWLMDKVQDSILGGAIVSSRVIPNGINLNIFCPGDKKRARERLCLPLDVKILLFSATGLRQNPWKNTQILYDTLNFLKNCGMPILCLAIGDTADSVMYSDMLKLQYIPFVDDQETMAEYYRAADVYIHPAKADTFPTVIIEALACGIPVVATNVGGIPEIVRDGEDGYLVTLGDAKAMSAKIKAILIDDVLREKMSYTGIKDTRDRFSDKRMVDEYLEYYNWVISFQTIFAHTIEK